MNGSRIINVGSESESESELLYDWRFTANQFVLATGPLKPTTSIFFFQLNTCGYSPYVTSTLTKGWVCRLQLLLLLASSAILRSETRGTHDHILLPQILDYPNLKGQGPAFISPRKRVAQLYPNHWVPFSRLLRLAGLWWRYSNPPPHRIWIWGSYSDDCVFYLLGYNAL
jgi:hypothetical protein